MEATNTCGEEGPTEYCMQTHNDNQNNEKSCEICKHEDHSAIFLTDHDNNDNATWWQSTTMLDGIQFPNQVNLTLRLGMIKLIQLIILILKKCNEYFIHFFKLII